MLGGFSKVDDQVKEHVIQNLPAVYKNLIEWIFEQNDISDETIPARTTVYD